MNAFSQWIGPAIRGRRNIYWCAGWFGFIAIAAFVAGILEADAFGLVMLLATGGIHAYAALGLLRGLKPAWHIATFLAFLTIILKSLATACAPGNIADGDRHLMEAALDIVILAIAILVFAHLRKPEIRRLYGVPESYVDGNGEDHQG